MSQTVRFASIPKCASRTLKALGLLGEVDGRHHSPITDYPEWEKYEWHVVLRDPASWYASWWAEAAKAPDSFTLALGLKFQSLADDLAILNHPPEISFTPPHEGINSWVPADFSTAFAPFMARGQGFLEFCYSTLTGGLTCTPVAMADLDAWLLDHGLQPIHVNPRAR